MALRTRAAANRRARGAARLQEVVRGALRVAQPCQPAPMRQVGVFESGDGVEQGLHTGALRVHAQAYRTPQRGKR